MIKKETVVKLKNAVQIASLALLSIAISGCDNTTVPSPQADVLQCVVHDTDIGKSYKGECKDGYAHGFGTAKGRDTYTGYFKNGLVHGQGKYEWGSTSEWIDEVWEGVSYKGGRTGYGVLTLGPKSKHISANSGDYSRGEVSSDGQRIIRGYWARGTLVAECKSEADCNRGLAETEAEIEAWTKSNNIEGDLQTKLKDRVFTLAELPYLFAAKNKAPDPLFSCMILENIDFYKETNSRALVDAQDLSNMFKLGVEPKHLLSSYLECELRSRQDENFLSKLSPYQDITVNELRASLKWLVGKRVRVSGNVVSILSNFALKDGPADMSPIFLDTKKTGRKVLLYAMENCSANPIHGCAAVISGTVANTDVGVGITLENIEVTKTAQEGVY